MASEERGYVSFLHGLCPLCGSFIVNISNKAIAKVLGTGLDCLNLSLLPLAAEVSLLQRRGQGVHFPECTLPQWFWEIGHW